MDFNHIPVMLHECMDGLAIKPNGVYVDGTMGGCGHSVEILKRLKNGRLICVDQDGDAVALAKEKLKSFNNAKIVRANFSEIDFILYEAEIHETDGILLDLGVSSYQFDEKERGFSYHQDARLDMRMDRRKELTAEKVVNTYSMEELTRVIYHYGEEKWAKRIAEFIVAERKLQPIETTFQLVEVIKKAVPKAARNDGPHPARRTFSAIRIEVNGELDLLEAAVRSWADKLKKGGRFCIITFHSLEDRIIKNTFRDLENPCTCPRDFPKCMCGKEPVVKVMTKKPLLPGHNEIECNRRSRSAKLRIAEKL